MTALLRPSIHPSKSVRSEGACTFSPGTVMRLEDDGLALVHCAGSELHAAVASHIPGLVQGQAVLLAVTVATQPQDSASNTPQIAADLTQPPLVIAAWPAPGAPVTPPWHFDRSTGTLALTANTLEVTGINSVLLSCGDAQMQFTRDGAVQMRGQSITSAATETHRIEGGSIELN